jgi:hypothetical protein
MDDAVCIFNCDVTRLEVLIICAEVESANSNLSLAGLGIWRLHLTPSVLLHFLVPQKCLASSGRNGRARFPLLRSRLPKSGEGANAELATLHVVRPGLGSSRPVSLLGARLHVPSDVCLSIP